jgi:hypothetical protein
VQFLRRGLGALDQLLQPRHQPLGRGGVEEADLLQHLLPVPLLLLLLQSVILLKTRPAR